MTGIRESRPSDAPLIFEVWRRAVEVTHEFLSNEDRAAIASDVQRIFQNTVMWVAVDGADKPLGFMISSPGQIDGLFVDPASHRKGIGRMFVKHALARSSTLTVDVNEQNAGAIEFYRSMGFVQFGRSALDEQGRPYPLLHLKMEIVG